MAMKIGNRRVGPGQPCYIIAEAGTNHLGSLRKAIEHASEAKHCGADAIKFQMLARSEPLFCPLPGDEGRWPRWNYSAMTFEEWDAVAAHCNRAGIDFLASVFQHKTVRWLKDLNVVAYKVASRAAATYPYDEVPGPFLISQGMISTVEVPTALPLQCVMKYPTPLAEAGWRGEGGLSDHSGTPWPGLDAMARGCPVLEVHFAIDHGKAGPDAPVCLTIDQLKLLCEARDAFAAMRQD